MVKLNEPYKIGIMDPIGIVKHIIVFQGSNMKTKLHELFSDIEIAEIEVNKTIVEFSDQQIHHDDSIYHIKCKVIRHLGERIISYNEIYLFMGIESPVHINSFIDRGELTEIEFRQFLMNIHIDEDQLSAIPVKSAYTYDDLYGLDLSEIITTYIPLGLKFTHTPNPLFSANPYDIISTDPPAYIPKMDNPLLLFENQLLLNYPHSKNRMIYACFADNVFQYSVDQNLDEIYMSELYFPLLTKSLISRRSDLLLRRESLLDENAKLLKATVHSDEMVDLYYNIYHTRKSEFEYLKRGIKSYYFIIHPDSKFLLPLDILFRNVHASKTTPFIKYNPGNRRENIYRLYSERVAKNGKPVPYLSKNAIIGLSKSTGKKHEISFFMHGDETTDQMNIDIHYNGDIHVHGEFDHPLSVDEMMVFLTETVNYKIGELNNVLEQGGNKFPDFKSLKDPHIEIISLKYIASLKVNKKIDLSEQIGCMKYIFNLFDDNLTKGAVLRFKRVENYQEMSAISALITEVFKRTNDEREVVGALIQNHNMTEQEALLNIADYLNHFTRIQGRFINKNEDIAENPGFPVIFQILRFENTFIAEIDNINEIDYIDVLHIYLDSFIRISQDPKSCDVPISEMKKCKSKGTKLQEIAETNAPKIDMVITVMDVDPISQIKKAQPLIFNKKIEDDSTIEMFGNPSDARFDEDDGNYIFFDEDEDEEGNDIIPEPEEYNKKTENVSISGSLATSVINEESLIILSPFEDEAAKPPTPINNIESSISKLSDIEINENNMSPSVIGSKQMGENNEEQEENESDIGLSPFEDEEEPEEDKENEESENTENKNSMNELSNIELNKNNENSEKNISPSASNLIEIEEDGSEQKESELIISPFEDEEEESENTENKNSMNEMSDIEISENSENNMSPSASNLIEIDENNKQEESPIILSPFEDEDEEEEEEENSSVYNSKNSINELSDIEISDNSQNNETPMKTGGSGKGKAVNNGIVGISNTEQNQPALSPTMAEKGKEIEGMSITHRDLFTKRLTQREPMLFLTKPEGKFDSYSRLCLSSNKRQPIILTKDELTKIDKEHPGSYTQALEYGTNPENPYYYICPRYWCLLTDTSMTEDEVKSGKCGKIIPPDDKKVPKGAYVYEFRHPKQHNDKAGNYIYNTPGFFSTSSHPKGYSIPCCFKYGNSELQKKRKEIIQNLEPTEVKREQRVIMYIMNIEKYPIPPTRWGFLPLSIQLFLQVDNTNIVTRDNTAIIKENTPCLLRYGVEQTSHQSFIGCIADLYAYKRNIKIVPTISEMKNIIVKAVTIDQYILLHNGSLVSIFRPKRILMDEVDYTVYQDSKLVKSIDITDEAQLDFLEETVASYENFIQYLKDERTEINHVYLWDIVCQSNPNLFINGMNLAILEIVDNDSTDNIELICPSSVYSKMIYDPKKETAILLKHDEFYEPIYLYENRGNVIVTKKMFYEQTAFLPLRNVLTIIQNSTNKYCSPQLSMPRKYEFKRNIYLQELYDILAHYQYTIVYQIANYHGKIIGVFVKRSHTSKKHVFLPCASSIQLPDLKLKFMDDPEIWGDYLSTRDELYEIKRITQEKVLCSPQFKVLEDGMIIGIITETNQFIQIAPPCENTTDDGIPEISGENYVMADRTISTVTLPDMEREKVVKRIRLENQFYSAFRNSIRMVLNRHENTDIKRQLTKLLPQQQYTYQSKLRTVESILKELATPIVVFNDFDDDALMTFDEITMCSIGANRCSDNKPYCLMKKGNTCKMIVPKKHLITGVDNEIVYFGRLADELLRYKRIQFYFFHEKTQLNVVNGDYKIHSDEFVMLQSLLTQDYFADLYVFNTNSYLQNVPFEIAEPRITQNYSNAVTLQEQAQMTDVSSTISEEVECIKQIVAIIGNPVHNFWKAKVFPKTAKEIVFHNTPPCTYSVIIYILQQMYSATVTVQNIKDSLRKAYSKWMTEFKEKIITVLIKQGKRDMMRKVKTGELDMDNLLMSESYYLTDLDIWILAQEYKLPIVLFSSTKLKHLLPSIQWLVLGGNMTQKYFFVRSSLDDGIPEYHVITPAFSLTELRDFTGMVDKAYDNESTEYNENVQTLANYLTTYFFVNKPMDR
jgi:hypothetical protein